MVSNTSDYSPTAGIAPIAGARVRNATALMPDAAHDAELVSRFLAGDEGAFAEIAERYRGRMYSVASGTSAITPIPRRSPRTPSFARTGGCVRFRGDSSLSTWLHRIAFNLSRNRHMHNFRRRRHDTLSLDCSYNDELRENFSDLIASDAPSPAREAAVVEFSETVSRCMGKLRPAKGRSFSCAAT